MKKIGIIFQRQFCSILRPTLSHDLRTLGISIFIYVNLKEPKCHIRLMCNFPTMLQLAPQVTVPTSKCAPKSTTKSVRCFARVEGSCRGDTPRWLTSMQHTTHIGLLEIMYVRFSFLGFGFWPYGGESNFTKVLLNRNGFTAAGAGYTWLADRCAPGFAETILLSLSRR